MIPIKLSQLPQFSGNSSGSYIVINDANNAITYIAKKEEFFTASLHGTASYSLTASYLSNYIPPFPYTGSAGISGSLVVVGNTTLEDLSGSNALFTGTITAQKLSVQYITASTELITGSTKFGTQLTDTHQFTGSVSITGSLLATSSWAENATTASYVSQAISASYAITASYVLNAIAGGESVGSKLYLFNAY